MNPNFLDFEQPIADLQAKIEELRLVGNDNALNISDEISRLQDKSKALTENIFGNLSSWQIAQLARHPAVPIPSTTSATCSAISRNCTATGISPTTRRSSVALPASTVPR